MRVGITPFSFFYLNPLDQSEGILCPKKTFAEVVWMVLLRKEAGGRGA
jgi:hypothetical protein